MKKKPTKEEWMEYAMGLDHEPLLKAVQELDQQKLEEYLTKNTKGNPYVFNPKRTT